jgi:hypothetical protein
MILREVVSFFFFFYQKKEKTNKKNNKNKKTNIFDTWMRVVNAVEGKYIKKTKQYVTRTSISSTIGSPHCRARNKRNSTGEY